MSPSIIAEELRKQRLKERKDIKFKILNIKIIDNFFSFGPIIHAKIQFENGKKKKIKIYADCLISHFDIYKLENQIMIIKEKLGIFSSEDLIMEEMYNSLYGKSYIKWHKN